MNLSKTMIQDLFTEPNPPSFALLHRKSEDQGDVVECISGEVLEVSTVGEVSALSSTSTGSTGWRTLVLVPFRQAIERGFECRDDDTPVIAMSIQNYAAMSVRDMVALLPDVPSSLKNVRFDVSDHVYARQVQTVLQQEIGRGEGSNFVIGRSIMADFERYSITRSLAAFRKLLVSEVGAYWTYFVHFGGRILIGASPERHLTLANGKATINPISGTYPYPSDGPNLHGLLAFLMDSKEANELYMVVDEELKTMARICDGGGTVIGPRLKEMTHLAHTEYLIEGSCNLSAGDLLRQSMFAPTVVGSPIENAFRVIARNESSPRGYYAGIIGVVGQSDEGRAKLDSAILIRMADISPKGKVRITVGASLVRDSRPELEVRETSAKASALLDAFGTREPRPASDGRPGMNEAERTFGSYPEVQKLLLERNAHLAQYWFSTPDARRVNDEILKDKTVLVIDAEDDFTGMLALQLTSLGLKVVVQRYDHSSDLHGYDLVVLGPGPGNPQNLSSPRIAALHAHIQMLMQLDLPVLAVCLGHQIACAHFGLEISRLETPNQGVQKRIDLFGRSELVGFYNTYTARCKPRQRSERSLYQIESISCDNESGDVYALKGRRIASFQFHVESILTERGVDILHRTVRDLLKHK